MRHLDYKYVVVFGSVWSDLLVMHNYCVIISEYQKVTLLGVEANKSVVKKWSKKQSFSKLTEKAKMFFEIVDL